MTTDGSKTPAPNGRFAVSESGMRELNGNREPWDLVKELVQNAWDEAPFASECCVTIEPQPDGNTWVIVQDDGPGFSDIADAYTLMGHTDKRLHPTKRGRFNMGEKHVISVAIEAKIETAGHTVTFPRAGGRKSDTTGRAKGTVVRVLMPWDEQQSNGLIAMLQRFRPPGNCRLFVNNHEVARQPAKAIQSASLQTVKGKPMRTTQRRTDIHISEPLDAESGWLYEMGIPVQVIDCPWDVDVMQKIPMSQQRDTVSESYLNRIYVETLNATYGMLKRDEFNSQWVKRAIEHPRINPQAVKATVKGRYGSSKTVFATQDSDANMRASADGYGIPHPGGLSKKEIEAFRKKAGVKDSDEVFPTPPPPRGVYEPEPGSNQSRFAEWVVEMAAHCNLAATVRYFNEPDNPMQADCSASTTSPTLRFNEARLGPAFFEPPYGSIKHWELLLHELGHALSDQSDIGHGEAWGEGVSKAGAHIAVHAIRNQDT